MNNVRDYFRSAFSINIVPLSYIDHKIKVLLVKRSTEPFAGEYSLPGKLMPPEEETDSAVANMLAELFDYEPVTKLQLLSFFDPERHPFGRVISIPYVALIKSHKIKNSDSEHYYQAQWFDIDKLPILPFDHAKIIHKAIVKVSSVVPYSGLAGELLPHNFSMSEFHMLHEILLVEELDKRNFSKKILALDILNEINTNSHGLGRPAKLYEVKNIKELQQMEYL